MSPAQEHSWWGDEKRPHLADLGHEYGGQDGTHAGDGLDGPVAGVLGKGVGHQVLEVDDLGVNGVDQLEQGVDPAPVGAPSSTASSSARPATPNRSDTATLTPCLASTACTWAFRPERMATSLAR